MVRQRLVLVVVVLLAVLALAGCTGALSDDPDPDAETLLEDALDGGDSEAVVGERTVEFVYDHGNETITQQIWGESPDRYRTEVVGSSGGEYDGDMVVRTESSVFFYDSDTTETTRYDADETVDATGETVEDALEASYVGTDTVADRDVHVIDVDVRNESIERGIGIVVGDSRYVYPLETDETDVALREQRLWIDEEYGYVLKRDQIYEDPDGSELEVSYAFEEVSFEEEIDEELLELPDDAEIIDPDPDQWEFEDRNEAEEAVPFDLPDAEFPDDYELQAVSADEYDGTITVHEEYEIDSELLWYSVAEEGLMPEDPDRENVGEVEASVVELEGPTLVSWECGDLEAELSGPFDAETLLALADGVSCE